MTTIKFYKQGGKFTRYKVSGHANYAEYGKDIVCCSISVLAQSTLGGLLEVAGVNAEAVVDAGYLDVRLTGEGYKTKYSADFAQVLIKTLELALLELVDMYPNNLKVIYNRDGGSCGTLS